MTATVANMTAKAAFQTGKLVKAMTAIMVANITQMMNIMDR